MLAVSLLGMGSCTSSETPGHPLSATRERLLTSEAGDQLRPLENVTFRNGRASGTVISIFPDSTKQTIDGIGTSFTESSAFVLAHLDPGQRREVMERVYGDSGANFTLTRTHIGACDFTVEAGIPTPTHRVT